MILASEYFCENTSKFPAIKINNKTKHDVESIFYRINKKLSNHTLTKEELLELLILAEYSEWNDVFLYVVNSFKIYNQTFSSAAIRIQTHKRTFEYYYDTYTHLKDKIRLLKQVPPIWNEKILIVDDEKPIARVLKAILNDEGDIDFADNGLTGLNYMKKNYYKLIISDIDMPVMDGLEFYQKASDIYPNLHKRFLFFTGNPSRTVLEFFRLNGLRYMTKPSDIDLIRENALHILLQNEELRKQLP